MISHTQIYNPLPTHFSTISTVAAIHSLLSSHFLSNGVCTLVMRISHITHLITVLHTGIAHFGVCSLFERGDSGVFFSTDLTL